MKVSDIMTVEVINVKKITPLKEAAGFLAKLRIHGMPVVDDENKVIGIITESDFFTKDSSNIYLPTFLDFIKNNPIDNKENIDGAGIEQVTRVEDIMTAECKTVSPDLSLKELIFLFKETNFNTFPVTDSDKTLSGIVTVIDVIKLL